MEKNVAIKVAAGYFPSYPTVNKLFVTTDEQVFFLENDAVNHARTLAKPKEEPVVIPVDRDDVASSNDEANTAKKLNAAVKKQEAAAKALEAKKTALYNAKEKDKEAAQKAVEEAQTAYDAATKVVDDLNAANK